VRDIGKPLIKNTDRHVLRDARKPLLKPKLETEEIERLILADISQILFFSPPFIY
jgi:hypothetical protein